MYLYAATIAVADGESLIVEATGIAGSIGNGRCFGKRLSSRMLPQLPFKASNWPTYLKAPEVDISISLGYLKTFAYSLSNP